MPGGGSAYCSIRRAVIAGDKRLFPAATVRIASTSCRGAVLEQEPARAGAQRGVDVLVEVEGREDQDPRRVRRRRAARVASSPSSPASGCPSARRPAAARAPARPPRAPSRGLADHLDVGLGLEDRAGSRSRTSAWSSASRTRSSRPPLERQPAPDANPPPRADPASTCRRAARPARACRSGRCRLRRRSRAARRRRRPPRSSTRSAVAHRHLGAPAPRVPEHVRQRLLDDPIRRQFDAGRQCGGVAPIVTRPASPARRPSPRDRDAASARRGRAARRHVVACRRGARRAAAASRSSAPRLVRLDRRRARAASVRVSTSRAARAVSPDDDHDHVVRDHVVELAGDPRPLVRDGYACALLPLRTGTRESVGQDARVPCAMREHERGDPDRALDAS